MRKLFYKFAVGTATFFLAAMVQAQPTREEMLFLDQMLDDGKVDRKEWARMHGIYERSNLATAKSLTTAKLKEKEIQPVDDGRLELINPRRHPWVPATQNMMNTDVDPVSHKPRWHVDAAVDYDADGKPDLARIHTNGSQWAVIITRAAAGKPPIIALKTDGSPFEIFGAGRRILISVPDLGSRLLLMHKGKPSIVFLGGD